MSWPQIPPRPATLTSTRAALDAIDEAWGRILSIPLPDYHADNVQTVLDLFEKETARPMAQLATLEKEARR